MYNDIVSRPTTNANDLQPNIVRSINSIQGSSCDQFNFNLASINSREMVYRSDLRITVRFNRQFSGMWPAMYALQTLDSTDVFAWNQITNTSGDSYPLVINVDRVVGGWVFNLDSSPVKVKGFRLLFLAASYSPNSKIDTCGSSSPVTLVPSATDDRPALVVYSRDPDANKVAAQALLKSLLSSDSATYRREADIRQARAATTPPSCGLNPLVLQASVLNTIPLLPGQSIIHPPSYDGGICGGPCSGAYPDNSSPTINLIAHFVTRSSPTSYKQCCLPVQYAPQTFVSAPVGTSGGVTTLTTLDNMRVTKCTCVDVTN